MGSWALHVQGHGTHNNDKPDDVDAMFAKFLKSLSEAGQAVDSASVVVGAGHALTPDRQFNAQSGEADVVYRESTF
jgi:hypothetical protein